MLKLNVCLTEFLKRHDYSYKIAEFDSIILKSPSSDEYLTFEFLDGDLFQICTHSSNDVPGKSFDDKASLLYADLIIRELHSHDCLRKNMTRRCVFLSKFTNCSWILDKLFSDGLLLNYENEKGTTL